MTRGVTITLPRPCLSAGRTLPGPCLDSAPRGQGWRASGRVRAGLGAGQIGTRGRGGAGFRGRDGVVIPQVEVVMEVVMGRDFRPEVVMGITTYHHLYHDQFDPLCTLDRDWTAADNRRSRRRMDWTDTGRPWTDDHVLVRECPGSVRSTTCPSLDHVQGLSSRYAPLCTPDRPLSRPGYPQLAPLTNP